MDFADISTETTEAATEAAITAARAKAHIKLFPITGRCYNCEAEVVEKPFCDSACRDDYEELKQRISNGRR